MDENEGQVPESNEAAGTPETPAVEPKVYDEIYVKKLRDESASWRTKYRGLEGKLSEKESQQKADEEARKLAEMSEIDKAQKRAADAEAAAEQARKQANETLILAKVIAEASKAGAAYPEDAFNLISRKEISIKDGNVEGVEDAVKSLVEAGRLVMRRQPAPNLDGGKGSGEREREKRPEATTEEAEVARHMGLTIEQYLSGKKKAQLED